MRKGFVRKLDCLNRVVVPREIMKTLEWPERPDVAISLFGDWVLLQLADGTEPVGRKVSRESPAQRRLIAEIQELSAQSTLVLLELAETLNNAEAALRAGDAETWRICEKGTRRPGAKP